jgi:Swt1-like HEPN
MIEEGKLPGTGTPDVTANSGTVNQFSFAIRVGARRMAQIYELLFCFENSVRELIEERLKEAYDVDTWWAKGVPKDIRNQAEKLKSKEKQTPWHGPRGGTLLAFVDFPILGRIITERCEDLLGKPAWVENVFDEVNQSRRAIAHTGVLSQHDVERMELRVRDWLRSVRSLCPLHGLAAHPLLR